MEILYVPNVFQSKAMFDIKLGVSFLSPCYQCLICEEGLNYWQVAARCAVNGYSCILKSIDQNEFLKARNDIKTF